MEAKFEAEIIWQAVDNLKCIHALGEVLYECAGSGRHLSRDTLTALGGMLLEKSKDALKFLDPPDEAGEEAA
jgi:hypothetical protein